MDKVLLECKGGGEWHGAVVCMYLLGMTIMFTHLGSPLTRPPPGFHLPRLLVMAAVAILVWRRGGLPPSTRQSTNGVLEAGMVITACSLALAYVWHLVEVITYVVLFLALTLIEALTGVPLTCDNCRAASQLHFIAVTSMGATILFRAYLFASKNPFAQRIMDECMGQHLGVRFWSTVKIVFINPKNHTTEHPMEVQLSAPGGGDRNPIVKTSTSPALI